MADIYSVKLIDGEVLAAGSSYQSSAIPVSSYKPLGNFGSQLLISGDGSVTVTLYTSMNGGDSYVEWPSELWDSETVGEYLDSHGFAVCTHFYVKATVTGGTGTTVTLWIGIQ